MSKIFFSIYFLLAFIADKKKSESYMYCHARTNLSQAHGNTCDNIDVRKDIVFNYFILVFLASKFFSAIYIDILTLLGMGGGFSAPP